MTLKTPKTVARAHLVKQHDREDFHFATAKNETEAQPLTEKGFDYVVTTPSGFMLFRKRK